MNPIYSKGVEKSSTATHHNPFTNNKISKPLSMLMAFEPKPDDQEFPDKSYESPKAKTMPKKLLVLKKHMIPPKFTPANPIDKISPEELLKHKAKLHKVAQEATKQLLEDINSHYPYEKSSIFGMPSPGFTSA